MACNSCGGNSGPLGVRRSTTPSILRTRKVSKLGSRKMNARTAKLSPANSLEKYRG